MKFFIVLAVSCFIAVGCAKKEEVTVSKEAVMEEKSVLPEAMKPKEDAVIKVMGQEQEEKEFKIFPVYSDKRSPDNHFIPSGWMGDYMDVKFEDAYQENPHGGATCIKITYNSNATGGARWAGIYWQYPANNWGGAPQHYDLTGASKLTFWIRGDKGGETIQEVKMGGIFGEYSDSDTAGVGPITLTTEWKQYTIDLTGKDLSHVIGGFVWSTNIDVNPEGLVFYLDDIKYE